MDRRIDVARYFPDVLNNALEFGEIANVENPEYELFYQRARKWFLNGFVMLLDEEGATRWEQMLKLVPLATDTLVDRRLRILRSIRDLLPYTHRRLEEILAANYGKDTVTFKLNYSLYEIVFTINQAANLRAKLLFALVRCIVPANLSILMRYTRTKEESNINFGCIVGTRKRMVIRSSGTMKLKKATGNIKFGCVVSQIKKITVNTRGY